MLQSLGFSRLVLSWPPPYSLSGKNGCGRAPDASRTLEFEEMKRFSPPVGKTGSMITFVKGLRSIPPVEKSDANGRVPDASSAVSP
eukprot:gene18714-biopygen18984